MFSRKGKKIMKVMSIVISLIVTISMILLYSPGLFGSGGHGQVMDTGVERNLLV